MHKITRREFLKITGAAAAGATLLSAGCAPQGVPPAATATLLPTAEPTLTPASATTLLGKVMHVHHAGVWAGKDLVPAALGQMLDSAVTQLTGVAEANAAWASLFRPQERIAIKVNAFRNSLIWTHPPLVTALTDRLQAAGVPAEQITIFDYYTNELQTAGFAVNPGGPGIRCQGTDNQYTTTVKLGNYSARVSDILMNTDALINVPVLKAHMLSGLTFALKNHYGSVDQPGNLHNFAACLPALNALPAIKDRTRLVIGDMLSACLQYAGSFPYWTADYTGDSILMSADPVAHDVIGLEWLIHLMEQKKLSSGFASGMGAAILQAAANAGLGEGDRSKIQLVETNLA
jgi:hypothetical protein